MAKEKREILAELKAKKHACPLGLAEIALAAWDFTKGRSKRKAQVWTFEHVTLTLHRPHGMHLKPGAVAMVIRKIEEADKLQRSTRRFDAF
jgi:hypothetical protein